MVIEEKEDGASPASTRKKKYHRRSPWACDECRLRKKKCDGTQPCAGCKEIDNACTYEFRRPAKAPTQRIRDLEEHLRFAQSFIRDLQQKTPTVDGVDFDSILRVLDFSAPESIPTPTRNEEASPKLASMMTGQKQMIHYSPWSTSFYGSFSGFAFVMRTLELFQKDTQHTEENSRIVAELFDRPLPNIHERATLPPRHVAHRVLDKFFAGSPLVQFVQEQAFRDMADVVYQTPDSDHGQFLPLLHILLALGYLHDADSHSHWGCDTALYEATKHFFVARASIDLQCGDLLSLQVVIGAISFLLATSRMVAAHVLLGLACSALLRLGLHTGTSVGDVVADETRARCLAAILNLDMFASLVLGLGPLLRVQDIDYSLPPRVYDGAGEADVRQIELMKGVTLSRDSIFNQQSEVDFAQLANVERDLQQWSKEASTLMGSLGNDIRSSIIKHDLEITYLFAQIVLYRPLLHYLRQLAIGVAIPLSQTHHALACLKIASTTILRSEALMKKGGLHAASWKSIYTLFLSIICLIFLIAAHNGKSQPSEAHRKVAIGIKVLAACRCTDDGASACLKILKMVVRQLKHTVHFDIDHIEATTTRLCGCQRPGKDPVTAAPTKLSLADILQGPEMMPSDADKMLAQAEEMDMALGFEDLMYFDDFSR